MGTLSGQKPRQESVHKYTHDVVEVLRDVVGTDPGVATPADWHAACDVLRTAFLIQDGDARDEQLSGFGGLFEELIAALRERRVAE